MAGIKENSVTTTDNGSIVSFKSLANVPLKDLEISFSPKQYGSGDASPNNIREIQFFMELALNHSGKNMIPSNHDTYTYVSSSGTGQIIQNKNEGSLTIKNGSGDGGFKVHLYKDETVTFTFKLNYVPESSFIRQRIFIINESTSTSSRVSNTIPDSDIVSTTYTADIEADYVFTFYAMDYEEEAPNGEVIFSNWQVELGSVATAYEPYICNQSSISWLDSNIGLTCGGIINPINGTLTKTHWMFGANGVKWTYVSNNGVNMFGHPGYRNNIKKPADSASLPDILCSNYKTVTYDDMKSGSEDYAITVSTAGAIFIRDSRYNTVEDFVAYIDQGCAIAFEVATPDTHSINTITMQTMTGTNNIWSNIGGNIEVEYYLTESVEDYKKKFYMSTPHLETSTGSIATFNTNAKLPLKSIKTTFSPMQFGKDDPSPDNIRPIEGWSQIRVGNSSFCQPVIINTNTYQDKTTNGITMNYFGNNLFGFGGTLTSSAVMFDLNIQPFTYDSNINIFLSNTNKKDELPTRKYVLGIKPEDQSVGSFFPEYSYFYDDHTIGNIDIESWAGKNIEKIQCALRDSVFQDGYFLIKPVFAKTPVTLSKIILPQTIYGGYIDFAKGQLVKTYNKIHFIKNYISGVSENQGGGTASKIAVSGTLGTIDINLRNTCICDKLKMKYIEGPDTTSFDVYEGGMSSEKRLVFGIPSTLTDLTSVRNWMDQIGGFDLCYPVTPVVTQLTPQTLKSLVGANNIWSNTNGIVQVEYWKH